MNGVWKAPPTGSGSTLRAPRSLASAVASAMASGSPAITTWPAPLLLATHTSPVAASQAARDGVVVGAEHRGHRAGSGVGGGLHGRAALGDEAHAVLEAQRADGGEGAVLAEAVAGGAGAAHTEAGDGVVHDEAQDVGGRAARSPCA